MLRERSPLYAVCIATTIALLGEIHGTDSSPASVASLTCLALDHGLDVTVGLEIPQSENERIQSYLKSEGTPWDQVKMLEGEFWQRDYQDGRSSRAMLDLIEQLRGFARSSGKLKVLLIDNSLVPDRDLFMARWLKFAVEDDPQRFFVALTGNAHSRTAALNNTYFPMGYRLTQLLPEKHIVSLQVTYGSGSAWMCTPGGCGVQQLMGDDSGQLGIDLYTETNEDGVAGTLYVGDINASLPAKDR